MRIDVIPITELSEGMKQRWLEIQVSNPDLAGPCFHPDLFITVGKFCPDVYVALLYDNNGLTGFLPYLRDQASSIAQTIDFCDYQAIIGPKSYHWDINMIMNKIGISSWHYNALVDFENIRSKRRQLEACESMRIDLSSGYKEYLLSKKDGKVKFGGLARKKRLIQSNFGPIHFVPICNDIDVLHRMLFWKSVQHNRDTSWTKLATELLEYFCFSNQTSIDGVFSALYAGNDLLAAYFGIRHQGILHSLVCSFNPDFKKFSPGLMIWQNLISSQKELGYHILDLGPEENKYKRYFSTSTLPIIKGDFIEVTIRDRIKSIKWLYQGLYPLVQIVKRMKSNNITVTNIL